MFSTAVGEKYTYLG